VGLCLGLGLVGLVLAGLWLARLGLGFILRNSGPQSTRMWANAQRDGRPPEHRWRPLFNAAKFG